MRKVILLIIFCIVLSFSVRAVCCDKGCYLDANCCGGIDGIGYVGCEATGSVFYCPQDDSIEGTPLPGGDSCLNCLCTDTYTCVWDDSNLCPTGEICLAEPTEGLPQTSWCVNENCHTCADCGEGAGSCTLSKCHDCYTGQCYYDPHIIGDDCYSCTSADSCSDYNDDPNACNGEITDCDLGDCFWQGNKCGNCADATSCEDYAEFNTCELNPCGFADCLWDGNNCFTIQPGICDKDSIAERGEACDGSDLRGKSCIDFGFDGGTLSCTNCEYIFSACTGYTCNKDGNIDEGEMCDCKGKTFCTDAQLSGYTCQDFDEFNGGILSCYNDCKFDTRSCSTCDKDGIREVGEVCDCGTGGCTLEQLKNKKCEDFGFSGGNLDCNNCEYDFSNCQGYNLGKCGDGTLDIGKEACDTNQFGGKTCNNFDEFSGGTLKCTDTCEFNTQECALPDADEISSMCELKYPGTQGECSKEGDYWCWDSKYKADEGECCGDDDDAQDKWIDINNNACCEDSAGKYVFQKDPDYSSCFCNLKGKIVKGTDQGVCDTTDETYCWSSVIKPLKFGRCCGDDNNENWNYSTSYNIDKILVKETCYNAKWKKRANLDLIYYDLSADLI